MRKTHAQNKQKSVVSIQTIVQIHKNKNQEPLCWEIMALYIVNGSCWASEVLLCSIRAAARCLQGLHWHCQARHPIKASTQATSTIIQYLQRLSWSFFFLFFSVVFSISFPPVLQTKTGASQRKFEIMMDALYTHAPQEKQPANHYPLISFIERKRRLSFSHFWSIGEASFALVRMVLWFYYRIVCLCLL